MNNAIYGKKLENLRNRIKVNLVNNKKDYLKCTSKPIYMFTKSLTITQLPYVTKNKHFKLNKPVYIEMFILELSKVLMYKFHCDYIKNIYDSNSKLLFTDTDTLMYEIKTEDVYEDFSCTKEMFDFSNCSTKLKYYDNSNKLVIGKMKDGNN